MIGERLGRVLIQLLIQLCGRERNPLTIHRKQQQTAKTRPSFWHGIRKLRRHSGLEVDP